MWKGEAMLDKLMTRFGDIQGKATVKTVFGEPMEVHGRTIVPVAKVRYGFGMGMGRAGRHDGEKHNGGEHEGKEHGGAGGGGGGGVSIRPLAVLEITDRETKITPIVDVTRVALGGIILTAWGIYWLSRALRAMEKRRR
jgi:uncharacterized spore protein YtfJ